MTLLRTWLIASAVVIAVVAVWALAPVLVFVALLVAGLGLISAAMIVLARRLRTWRDR